MENRSIAAAVYADNTGHVRERNLMMTEEDNRHKIGLGKIRWKESQDATLPYGSVSLFAMRQNIPLPLMVNSVRGKKGKLIVVLLSTTEFTIGEGIVHAPENRTSVSIDRFEVKLLEKLWNRTVTLYFMPDE